jgi:sn-glycerol 3-phosphate transport system substrate-binding protein
VTLGACGGSEEDTPTSETPGAGPSGGTVTIDLWHSEVAANQDVLDTLVSQYNSSQSEVRVRLFYQGTPEEILAKLVASLGSGQVPAIAILGETDSQMMIDSGAVAPVQEFIDSEGYDLSDLNGRSLQEYTIQGKLWAMPFGAGIPLLYYNKVIFREVGLDPEKPPRDLEEVRQYSERILKRDASGNVARSGIAIDVKEWTQRTVAEHDDLLVDNNNGRDGRATKVLFNNDTGRWFFQWWHDMVDEGLAFNVGRNPSFADGLLAMVSGRAAMTFSFSSALRSVVDALEGGSTGRRWEWRPCRACPGARVRLLSSPVTSGSSTCGRRKSRRRPGSSSSGWWSRSSRPSGSPAAALPESVAARLAGGKGRNR